MSELQTPWIVALAIGLLSVSALAQDGGTLEVSTTVEKEIIEVNEDGESTTRLIAADTVVPGERVIYTTTFRNLGSEAADNVVITNPISDSLTYVEGSAFGPGMQLEFSVDGGATFGAADTLRVSDADGERAARSDDYTHLRWTLLNSLDAGAQGVVRFTATLQ